MNSRSAASVAAGYANALRGFGSHIVPVTGNVRIGEFQSLESAPDCFATPNPLNIHPNCRYPENETITCSAKEFKKMTRFSNIALITSIAFLVSCDGEDARPLDDIYGEWSYKMVVGHESSTIAFNIYLDSDSETSHVEYGRQYNKGMKAEEVAAFRAKYEEKYITQSAWLKKELSAQQLSFFKESNGRREIKLRFKILESKEKSMTVELLEASEDTRVQSLLGKTLIFQINRKRNKEPVYDSQGNDGKKTYFFHGGPRF
jgi:hypothetical protein